MAARDLTVTQSGRDIAIFSPANHALWLQCPLNARVHVDLKSVGASEAVRIIAKTAKLPLFASQLSGSLGYEGKPVTLVLDNVTVRNGLNQIAKNAGIAGWTSLPNDFKEKPNGGELLPTVILFR